MEKLYYHSLGLQEPWKIADVQLDIENRRVNVLVEYGASSCHFPKCQSLYPIYDHVAERSWKHLDSCGFKTYIHSKIPRSKCDKHGSLQINIPWA